MSIRFLTDFFDKNDVSYHDEDSFCPTITYVLNGEEHTLSFDTTLQNKTLKSNDNSLYAVIECSENKDQLALRI